MAPHNEKDLEHIELQSQSSTDIRSSGSDTHLGHLRMKSEDAPSPLPSPVSAALPKPSKAKLSSATIIPIWIVLSSSVIIYNNYVYNTIGFKYPVFLVTFHLGFAVSS